MITARRIFTCGALFSILAARPCSAQIGYRALVDEYAYGRTAATAAELAGDPEASVRSAVGSTPLPVDRIKAAAMLHTETALAVGTRALAFFHIEHAHALLDSVAKVDRDRLDLVKFTGRWSAIEAIVYASFGDAQRAQRVIEDALRTNNGNVDALLVLGVLQEMAIDGNEPNPRGQWNGRVDVDARAKAAADSYAALVQRHPESVEARVRLGWALLINHSTTALAREQLQTAAARATRPDLRYLAHLFLGAVEARDDHLDQAASEYAQAHAIMPRQASFMALIQIDRARGLLGESEQLALAFARNPPGGLDPWQSYRTGMTGDELLEWLRTEARAR